MKKALITGITGQDGSYLAEFLIEKGYEVHGIVRRSSVLNRERIDHLIDIDKSAGYTGTDKGKLILHYGDLTDSSSIEKILKLVIPDEVYNLGAQSHVRISFDIPENTGNIVALGTLRLLEAIKNICPKAKFYQASSSEMYGKVKEIPQTENTPFAPRSPYACAKVYAYYITKNYREAYEIFACNGILFNHECISENTPLIIKYKETNIISIKRIKDIIRVKEKGTNIQQWELNGLEVWDGENFVDLKFITATKRKKNEDDFHCRIINTRNGIIETTNHHNLLNENSEKVKNRYLNLGDKILHKPFPLINSISKLSKEEALFLGMIVGDGYIHHDGKAQFTNNDEKILKLMDNLWKSISLGYTNTSEYKTEYGHSKQMILNGNLSYLVNIRKEIYTYDGFKKVPDRILNADKEIKLAFLTGYNITDGLKANPCTYDFKNFKTNSIILAQGLLFLISQTTMQEFNINFEKDNKYYGYYSINFLSPNDNGLKEKKVHELIDLGFSQREISRSSGISRNLIRKIENGGHVQILHHLSKQKEEIKKMLYHDQQPEWVYDVETESGKLMAGVGKIVISNSERRGESFVTRKITLSLARIKAGLQDELYLGNLDSERDWGHAKDYVKAMWLILQQDEPEDYVIGTGEKHTVREFLEEAAKVIGLNIKSNGKKGLEEEYIDENGKAIIKIHPGYFRPTEVDLLLADPTKAKIKLGWVPEIKFKELVKIMCEHDLKLAEKDYYLKNKAKVVDNIINILKDQNNKFI